VADRPERVVGLCTAAFILAAAGLLDGKRATTHWLFGELLATRHPTTVVDTAPIFICDDRTWTSAGNVAGFDLLLALIGQALRADAVRYAARNLVVFLIRPGKQAQFSAQPFVATSDRRSIRELQRFIADDPRADLSLARLAARLGLSPRHLSRVFQAEGGDSTARHVERARLEGARRCLEDSELNLEAIATVAGFGSMKTMRRAFHQRLSVSPSEYRRIFGPARRPRPRMLAG
jgi:transcriptional regulator GlxA family with amidase domain